MVATTSPTTSRRPRQPDDMAHLIFQWVKMEGKTQSWVASALNISQATVSRIIQRYERWQAHAKEREGGQLDPAERLRAQRRQTFDRNEQILASCLRIAAEMEGFVDTSKSTISRPAGNLSQETTIRTTICGSTARGWRPASCGWPTGSTWSSSSWPSWSPRRCRRR